LNILYYIPSISQQWGGIRQYAVACLKILARDEDNQYFIYHEASDPEVVAVLNQNPQLKLIKTTTVNYGIWNRYINLFKRKLADIAGHSADDNFFEDVCKNYLIDIIHCPYQYLPQSKHAKSICTMHDVQELHFPEYFTPQDRADRAVNYLKYIKNADNIVVSYKHIKDDIIKYFHAPSDKVNVCLLDMENLWFNKFNSNDIDTLEHLEIHDAFILYPANTWQHKNHHKLLEAIVILKEQGLNDIKLVCTGHKTPYYDSTLKPFIEQYDLKDQIIFMGVVDEKLLYSLYKKCLGVIVPTLYEAGSFPLMEAILLEVPVICSNVTSLPETIGDDNFIFNATDAFDISNKLKQLHSDKMFRQKSIINSKKQAGYLRNTNSLNIIKAIYNSTFL
jgi:glycosyltransferase involved in cell wall biosynthesis